MPLESDPGIYFVLAEQLCVKQPVGLSVALLF